MRITLPLFTLFLSLSAFSQIQVLTSNVDTNDLIYDPITNRIYATIPSTNGVNGNSIGAINPNTSTLEYTVPIGPEPTVIAMSDDGAYIYVGFDGSSTIRPFTVATKTAGTSFSLGSDLDDGEYYAEDIEVMPGTQTTIAVSRMNKTATIRHEGVAIYDGSTMRTNTTSDGEGSNVIEFTNASTLVGYNNETTGNGLRELNISPTGVTEGTVTQGVLSGDLDFTIHNQRLYATDGSIVDISGTPTLLGNFPDANGPGIYDENFDLVVYATYTEAGVITFKRYNPETFALVDETDVTQATGSVKNLTICGEGCYAFNTSDDKVVIVRNLVLGATEFMEVPQITMYPNPATDFIFIKSNNAIKSVSIVDINGRIVKNISAQTERVDITHLSQGMYIVKMIDYKDQVFTEKLMVR